MWKHAANDWDVADVERCFSLNDVNGAPHGAPHGHAYNVGSAEKSYCPNQGPLHDKESLRDHIENEAS